MCIYSLDICSSLSSDLQIVLIACIFVNHTTLCVSAAIAVVVCLSVTHGIVSKWTKVSSNFFLGLVVSLLWFSNYTYCFAILTGRGACHSDGLGFFSV